MMILLNLDDLPIDQGDDAVSIVGHFRVVGDQYNGLAVFPGKASDHFHDFYGGLRIQVAGRLVGEYYVRLGDKGLDSDANDGINPPGEAFVRRPVPAGPGARPGT